MEHTTLLDAIPADLKRARSFRLDDLAATDGSRVEFWEEPRQDWLCCIGGDTAYGIPGRDYDALHVLCKHPPPLRQVAEAQGHFGDRFDRLVYAMARYFNDAFIVIERQTLGLVILQRLWHDYDYRWLYYERRESEPNRPLTANLGHPKSTKDLVLWEYRRAIVEGTVLLRSMTLMQQMSKLQFRPRGAQTVDERVTDDDLRVKLAGGGSPDLVMAGAYAYFGSREVVHFPRPPKPYAKGTLGDILGHNDTFEPANNRGASWVKPRRKR